MNLDSQPLPPLDQISQKAPTLDAGQALCSPADAKQSLATMKEPALVAAEKIIDQHFGTPQLFDSSAPAPGTQPEHKEIKDVQERISDAPFPHIAQMWQPADPRSGETKDQTEADHDLVLSSVEGLHLDWKKTAQGESSELTEDSVRDARNEREKLLALNPNMVTIAEIRYHDATAGTFPAKSGFWQDGPNGKPIPNDQYDQYQMTNWSNKDFQKHVVDQAVAVIKSGAADGVMLDWWHDGHDQPQDKQEKMKLLEEVRHEVGNKALIMINTNEETLPEITPLETKQIGEKAANQLVNGYYMECSGTKDIHNQEQEKEEYRKIEKTLAYTVDHTAGPQITVVETWHDPKQPRHDQQYAQEQERQMRATTTLAMTLSNGYSLYGDPDGMKDAQGKSIPDHGHEIYPFYSAGSELGKPLRPEPTPMPAEGKSIEREFENGTVVCNASGDGPVTVEFKDNRVRLSTGEKIAAGTEVQVAPQDGDIFIKGN